MSIVKPLIAMEQSYVAERGDMTKIDPTKEFLIYTS